MVRLRLSFACSRYDKIEALVKKEVRPEGVELVHKQLPVAETYFRQLRYKEFDVSEMSISFFLIAKALHDFPYLAIPVFPMRDFFHCRIVCNSDAGITRPRDLAGKRFGLPEYAMSLGLWIRGVLQHEYGIPPEKIRWFVERTGSNSIGAAIGFHPPTNVSVQEILPGKSMASMLIGGELDAGFVYYEQMKSRMERSSTDMLQGKQSITRLYGNPKKEAIRYYKKTGFYPVNHVIMIREELLREHPWLAMSLFEAFSRSKHICLDRNRRYAFGPNSFVWLDLLHEEFTGSFGDDPFPYGFKRNRKIIDAMTGYSNEQGLTPKKLEPEDLFHPSTLGT